ncbi:MAG: endonuclease [Bacteroidetes bacterium]|nr:endonuclease [Bacteroidota bacterium]MBU1116348.1 endonuclease [Bacteroidota bacterium]MBU1800372.1 endonuclease [Bacteroidota bacterium]
MKKIKQVVFIIFFLSTFANLFAQYYDGISTSSSTFVEDLQTLIRSNYIKKSYNTYDENMIPGFYARDNGDSTNSVFCVYSHFEYVYSGTFTWTVFSREHTFCYSWMPTNGSTSNDEYSDYHHLFPTHQNGANGVRSNHPLGIVQTVTSAFLEGTYGKNSKDDNVYEPRDEHKGDAARALLYMVLRYDGINGNDWDFNWLNGTRLPALNEGEQDLQTLLDWHVQDLPDSLEISRNDYIYNLQNNRNPFIDHPEYIDLINFNDLSKISTELVLEPENQLTNLSSNTYNNSITLSWTDAVASTQAPSGYLIEVFTGDEDFVPIDGIVYPDDFDFSDGSGIAHINYSDVDTYTFSNLDTTKTYYFTIFSYNGAASEINYKDDGLIPKANSTVAGIIANSISDLIITEYIEGSSNNKALEIFNGTGLDIDLSLENYKIEIYYNGASINSTTINLSGIALNNDVFVISNSSANSSILNISDQTAGNLNYNGDDAIVLKKGSTIIDSFGEVGFDPGTEWGSDLESSADNSLRRKQGTTFGDINPNDTFLPSVEWKGYEKDTFDDLGNSNPLPIQITDVNECEKFEKTQLFQNHPNPFNPSTQISFSLAETGKVNLSIYNIIGQKIAELINQNMEYGNHNVEFNASTNGGYYASGLYIYRLETPNYTKSMKMIFLK